MSTYRPKLPLSLCLIAKNETENIRRFAKCLGWLSHPEDEVIVVDTGSTDGTPDMFRKRVKRCTVIERPDLQDPGLVEFLQQRVPKEFAKFSEHGHYKEGILRSFAEARQIGFDAAKNEHIMWLDLDDILEEGELLRKIVDTVFAEGRRGAIFLKYDYTINDQDEATTVLWRERIVSKGDYVWKGACHETLIPGNNDAPLMFARDPECPVRVRHVGAKEHQFSDMRNYAILYRDYFIKKDNDPRTLFYLGNAARGLGLNGEAIEYYTKFCPLSGNPDDIMAAKLGLAGSYSALSMFHSALRVCADAKVVRPEDPRPYYMAANIWANVDNWRNTVTETQLGDMLQMPDTLHACEPHMIEYQPQAILATAFRELYMPREALAAAEKAAAARPNAPEVRTILEDFRKWASAEQMMQQSMQVLSISENQPEMIKHMKLSPHYLARGIGTPEGPFPIVKGQKSIAFWCGTSHEAWGPESITHGIGASEKMVYDMARSLAKKGWRVQVYCTMNCPEGVYDGVQWQFTARFDPKIYRDVVVVWRVPEIVAKIPFQCEKLYIWMHDVGRNSAWTPEILAAIDKVLFLSEFQRKLHPAVPDEQAYITRNGIDLKRQLYNNEPKEKKIIFCSSPDRGFVSTVTAFRKSNLEKQDWKLHLFYGFGKTWRKMASDVRYQYIPDIGRDCDAYAFADMCAACCDGEAVIGRGRVGWAQMAHEMKTGSIWLYPTVFDEISCVSAMEAMAAASAVVATMHGALRETCKDYPLLWEIPEKDGHADIDSAAADLQDAARAVLAGEHRDNAWQFAQKFDIESLVESWCRDLFS